MSSIRILLADDHNLVRAGIRSLLQHVPEVQVIAEAEDGKQALQLVETLHPDIVLMDIAMPELNGLEATAKIRKDYAAVRVIILSMHSTKAHVMQALRAGASGYLLKGAATSELELAIRAVARGETFLCSGISKHLVDDLRPRREGGEPRRATRQLTPRQCEILTLIAQGNTTKEIARKLAISIKTVKTHRTLLMQQLDIHDIAGLVRYAMQADLIPPEAFHFT